MPVIDFPSNPSNNELFIIQGKAMRYNSDKNKWRHVSTMSSSQVSDLENKSVGISSMSVSGNTLVIQKDDSTHANVSLAQFAGNILTNYSSASQLPITGLIAGSQVYVTDTDSLFITDGSGWYKVATVNLSPSLSLGVSSISMGSGGSVDINYTVNEPEDTPYTVTASATANATITVHQANNTITFDNPIAATSETITISATDGINTVADTLTMTISIGPDWPNATTTLFNHPASAAEQRFGNCMDMDETTLVVGSTAEDNYRGAVRVYTRASESDAWSLQQTINGPTINSGFAGRVSLDGDNLAVGMTGFDNGGATNTGGVQIWVRTGTTWSQQGGNIVPSNTQYVQHSVGGVKISGDNLLIATPYDDNHQGSVYYYSRSGTTWTYRQKVKSNVPSNNRRYGDGLDIVGNILIVGDRDNSNSTSGQVHIYTLTGTTWSHNGTITPSDGQPGDDFSSLDSVVINANSDTIAVGARHGHKTPVTSLRSDSYASGVVLALPFDSTHAMDDVSHSITGSSSTQATLTDGPASSNSTEQVKWTTPAYANSYKGTIGIGAANQYVLSTPIPSSATGTFVIEGWFYSLNSTSNSNWAISSADVGGRFLFGINNSSTFDFNGSSNDANDIGIGSGWHHIAIVCDSGAKRFYYDGLYKGQWHSPNTGFSTLHIGQFDASDSNDYRGYIQDFKVTIGTNRGYIGTSQSGTNFVLPGSMVTEFAGADIVKAGAVYVFKGSEAAGTLSNAVWMHKSPLTYQAGMSGDANANRPYALGFKPDGTKAYIADANANLIYQYSLATPYEVTDASMSYDSVSFGLVTSMGSSITPASMKFKPDGTKLFVLNGDNKTVYEYNLSTPYDLSTVSYNNITLSISSVEGFPEGIFFKPDGTKMYVVGTQFDSVRMMDLSTPWDISTATYNNANNFSVTNQDSEPMEVVFDSNGTKMYMLGGATKAIYSYTLSSAWDVTTAVYDNEYYSVASGTQAGTTGARAVVLSADADENKLFVVGDSRDEVNRIDLPLQLTWSEQAKLVASDAVTNDNLGTAIDIDDDGNTIVVSSKNKVVGGNSNVGQGYIFTRDGTTWTEEKILTGPTIAQAEMGSALSLYGSRAMLGAPNETIGGNSLAGRVYQFDA